MPVPAPAVACAGGITLAAFALKQRNHTKVLKESWWHLVLSVKAKVNVARSMSYKCSH
jgi:hypothetical protein